jgi:type II secretory pathway component PulF
MADNLHAFEWSGIDSHGKRVKGILRVNDGKEVQAELKKQGIELINFKLRKDVYA